MADQKSNEEIYKQVTKIVSGFGIFQCAECAEAVKIWLRQNRINYTHLKLTIIGRGNFILSERWDGSKNSITQNGTHYGVEVCGKVFDNLSATGLSRKDWINDFTCPSGRFNIEEIEKLEFI
ncbi:papain fold toxin domain-containing protein [Merismopedia glauca]|uniref:Tox-PL-2 domain-containing protein n=1 Tax=Merismopedia glauca CCAP 1448/3 TaxID=1296344 RepID=A0A2T1CAG5_9CYAN|nr:papain fold toxin domain-containing protein [Merismopedia glauca]PSB05265.1 hypothetical protein C7B64_00225 [Merismopedia glauca CCAP 1448/3]